MQKPSQKSWIGLIKAATLLAVLVLLSLLPSLLPARSVEVQAQPTVRVIHISVDALGSKYLEKFLRESPQDFNHFARLINQGASTFNARTDFTSTSTLPNHTSMVTGRPVKTSKNWQAGTGHFWEWNGNFPDPKAPVSIHANNPAGTYIVSTFDVVHDNGLSTAMYSGKSKFKFFTISYGPKYGAQNANGHNKVDYSVVNWPVHAKAIADMKANKPVYTFLHYPEMDGAGHAFGYLGAKYRTAGKMVNGYLGEVLALVDKDPVWKNNTVIILSADHGGQPGTKGHGIASHPFNYTIPFIVWGKGVAKGADLYELNKTSRKNPGDKRVPYAPTGQPIRNGDGGNLALDILGLPAIPGSHINSKQDLKVR